MMFSLLIGCQVSFEIYGYRLFNSNRRLQSYAKNFCNFSSNAAEMKPKAAVKTCTRMFFRKTLFNFIFAAHLYFSRL